MERRAFSVAIFARHAGHILLIRHRRLATWLPVGAVRAQLFTPSVGAVTTISAFDEPSPR